MAAFKITVKAEKKRIGGNFQTFEVKMSGMSVGKMMALRRILLQGAEGAGGAAFDLYCGVRNAQDSNQDYLMENVK